MGSLFGIVSCITAEHDPLGDYLRARDSVSGYGLLVHHRRHSVVYSYLSLTFHFKEANELIVKPRRFKLSELWVLLDMFHAVRSKYRLPYQVGDVKAMCVM